MTDIAIKRHRFDLAQNRLKEFSEGTEADIEIAKVRTDGGLLDLFDHLVTGDEFNSRIKAIQKHFIAVNQTNNKVIKEFREVYNALDALDKEYIASILANVKAIEKTSNDVRSQQKKLVEHHEELKKHQTEIEDSVKTISKIVQVLKNFKAEIEALPDLLRSASETESALDAHTQAFSEIWQSLEDTNNTVTQISDSLSKQIERIEALYTFVDGLETITHLRDIDGMWDSLSNAHASLEKLFDELKSAKDVAVKHQQDIDKALSFIKTVSQYEHLKDIDAIWSNVDKHGEKLNVLAVQTQKTDEAVAQNQKDIAELNQGLSAIAHLNDVDTLWASNETHSEEIKELQEQNEDARILIQQNKDHADQSLADEKSRTETALQSLNKKIQYAYWIAGGSMALALIELFVILLG